MDKIKIVCLGGSMEKGSSTLEILKYAAAELKKLGAEVYLADIKSMELPMFSYKEMSKVKSKAFSALLKHSAHADGFIFASPEYHGTVGSAFKDVIDYLEILSKNEPPYLTLKPVGCIAIGGAENSGYATLNSMISITHNLRGVVSPSSFAAGSGSRLPGEKKIIADERLLKRVKRLVSELYLLAVKLKY